jgi:hypothetical protein
MILGLRCEMGYTAAAGLLKNHSGFAREAREI